MADRKSLGILGYVCGGVTAAVMLMAFTVVMSQASGRLSLEDAPASVVTAAR